MQILHQSYRKCLNSRKQDCKWLFPNFRPSRQLIIRKVMSLDQRKKNSCSNMWTSTFLEYFEAFVRQRKWNDLCLWTYCTSAANQARHRHVLVTPLGFPHSLAKRNQFSSRCYLCPWKNLYALHPVSQKFPQSSLWNHSFGLFNNGPFSS